MADVAIDSGTRAEREAYTPTGPMLWFDTDYGQWAYYIFDTATWVVMPISAPAAMTLGELLAVTAPNDADELILNRPGAGTRKITMANMLADMLRAAAIASGTSVERASATPDGPQIWYETDTEVWWYWKVGSSVWAPVNAPPPGYISGLQINRAGDTEIIIQPGSCEIGGKLFVLPSAVTITVTVTSSLTWRGIRIVRPSTGYVLTAGNFSDVLLSSIVRSADGSHWVMNDSEAQRIIGIYPTLSSMVHTEFRTTNGLYYTYMSTVYEASPPSVATSYAVGTPCVGESLIAQFMAYLSGDASTTYLGMYMQNIPLMGSGGSDVRSVVLGRTANGYMDLRVVATGGAADMMALYLLTVTIPTGMAR